MVPLNERSRSAQSGRLLRNRSVLGHLRKCCWMARGFLVFHKMEGGVFSLDCIYLYGFIVHLNIPR